MTDSKRVTREGLATALHATARPHHIGKLPDLTACTGTAVHMADADAIFDALPEPAASDHARYTLDASEAQHVERLDVERLARALTLVQATGLLAYDGFDPHPTAERIAAEYARLGAESAEPAAYPDNPMDEYPDIAGAAWAEYQRVTATAWAEYDRIAAPAWAEYQRVTAAALAEYERVTATARAEYDRIFLRIFASGGNYANGRTASDPAWVEYKRVRVAAWAECKRVEATASAEYERVRVPAWAEYQRATAAAHTAICPTPDCPWDGGSIFPMNTEAKP